jgi:ubiquinone/menaquinone biosynthesis C-methylase UbiE
MNLPPNFNRLARLYRWMEYTTFGPFLGRARCAFLAEVSTAHNALILGDGDGRFTWRLLRTNSKVHIDAVDASAAMLDALMRRVRQNSMSDAARVRTHLADARTFPPPNPAYDLIVTHFFLDCLTTSEIQTLAATLRTAAAPNALWLVSEFAVPPTLFGHLIAAPIVHTLYRAFGLLTGLAIHTLPDHRAALRQSGFTLQTRRTHLAGLLVSELWAATARPSSE